MGKGEKEETMEINVSKADKYNAMNCAEKAEEHVDELLTIKGLFSFEDDVVDKETGEVSTKTINAIITDTCTIATPSEPFAKSIKMLLQCYDEDEVVGLQVSIKARKSNNGRTFYQLAVID